MRILHSLSQYGDVVGLVKILAVAGLTTIVEMSFAQTPETAKPAEATAPATTEAPAPDSALPAAEKPTYTSTIERDNALLASAKPDEIQWLETPNEKFLALYKLAETRKTKGSLLILHAPELPQLWPAQLDNLRRNLPLYGWETMTVPLPQKYAEVIPKRELPQTTAEAPAESAPATDPAAAQTDTEAKPPMARDQLINERVAAAVAQINKNGKFNLVVLVDNSSAPFALADLLKKTSSGTGKGKINGPIQAVVLVNLQDKEPLTKEQLAAIFSMPDLPVMDVFLNPDDQIQIDVRRLHKAEAMRQNLKNYQQLILPPEHLVTVDSKQTFWLEKVRGFMKQVEGDELPNRTQASAQ